MTTTAQLAYANARVRARRSRIVPAATLSALAASEQPELTVPGWRDIDGDDASPVVAIAFARLMDDYAAIVRACPPAAATLRSLARLHENENVKLAWRAVCAPAAGSAWHRLWRPLAPLETVTLSACAAAGSVRELADALKPTPFGAIAAHVQRAHGTDLAAAEMAFDRWSTAGLAVSAAILPKGEYAAADLIRLVVCERETSIVERAVQTLGVDETTALRMTPTLAGMFRDAPARVAGRAFEALRRDTRSRRRRACDRAFLRSPFCLAPAVALLLLREDEARALISVGELRAHHATASETARVLTFDG